MKFIVVLFILISFFIIGTCNEGFVNYADFITVCKDNVYYEIVNKDILSSPRLNSYRSYDSNKDMYSLNSRILKDKECRPNAIPTSFH